MITKKLLLVAILFIANGVLLGVDLPEITTTHPNGMRAKHFLDRNHITTE